MAQSLDDLKRKYQSAISIAQSSGPLQNANMQGDKLFIRAEVASEDTRNKVWNEIKRAESQYKDLTNRYRRQYFACAARGGGLFGRSVFRRGGFRGVAEVHCSTGRLAVRNCAEILRKGERVREHLRGQQGQTLRSGPYPRRAGTGDSRMSTLDQLGGASIPPGPHRRRTRLHSICNSSLRRFRRTR